MQALIDLSDAQLVVLVGRYNDGALAEIYRRHGRSVYGLARKVVTDGTEAEDITQEIFLNLWRHPSSFDSARGSLRTFLLTHAHGRAVDVVRSRVARKRREENDAHNTAAVYYDLEREVWDLALSERVSGAMASLPSEERAAIELAYFEGHTYREVAQLLSQPEGTVKSRIRNGLRRMKSTLAAEGVRA
jgi:RNA polymerase sigma-70 factor, ECF subfamily